ncbi:MAG TPA: secretin N-terminal domain-containing protein [Syntrophorhabdaceae bacterium]|nr:secretin N-terminal domain-containing protein [Syntrophorhabdaceae bacterium]
MRKLWIYAAMVCFLCSCAHVQQAKEKSPTVKPPEIPSPVSFQIEKEKRTETPRVEEVFSFSLREADVKDILRAIGKQANYNVVVEPDVKGTATVDLKDVTLVKALEYILEPLSFTYKIENRTIYVSRPKVETRMFSLNYIALKKTGTSNVYATPGTIGGTTTTTGVATTTSSTYGSQVSVRSETDSDIWKSLEDNIKGLLSKDGKFVVNKQAMMIIVTDYPRILKDIDTFLKAAEGVIHRQVMIEAKIVEVLLNDSSRQGVNWKMVEGRIGEFNFRGQQALLNQFSDPALSTTTAVSGTPFFRIFAGNGNLDINNTFIDLLKIFGKVETISSPKISTLNNQRAIIKVTTQDVYFDVQQTAVTGSANPTITYTPRFIDEGLTLDVTPQIDDKGNITLNIHPIMSERTGDVVAPGGVTTVPILNVREVDTIVKVKEGETVVIGGLIKSIKSNTDTGTKGLMSIPVIGQFFKVNETSDTKSELVVFLTPRVIYEEIN